MSLGFLAVLSLPEAKDAKNVLGALIFEVKQLWGGLRKFKDLCEEKKSLSQEYRLSVLSEA